MLVGPAGSPDLSAAEVQQITQRLAAAHPEVRLATVVRVEPLRELATADSRPVTIWPLSGRLGG